MDATTGIIITIIADKTSDLPQGHAWFFKLRLELMLGYAWVEAWGDSIWLRKLLRFFELGVYRTDREAFVKQNMYEQENKGDNLL